MKNKNMARILRILPVTILALAAQPLWAQTAFVANPSFESDYNTNFPFYVNTPGNITSIDGWSGGSGIGHSGIGENPVIAEANGQSSGNATAWGTIVENIPDRDRVAFMQANQTLSQDISGLTPGKQYWLQFWWTGRNCCGATLELDVSFGGAQLTSIPGIGGTNNNVDTSGYYFANFAFTPTNGAGILTFQSVVPSGDATVGIDAVNIVQRDAGNVVLMNPSFEASGPPTTAIGNPPAPDSGEIIKPAAIAGWQWDTNQTGTYGISLSGGLYADNGAVPDQALVGFISGPGSLSQTVSNLFVGGAYQLTLYYNAQSAPKVNAHLQVTAGGAVLIDEDVAPVGGSNPYHTKTVALTPTSSTAVITFAQTNATGTLLLDNVSLSASGACSASWTQRPPLTPSPSAREHHTMAYDSVRGRTVLFGGSDGSSYLGDTWEWNGANWAQVATTGPSARDESAMAYDSAHGVVVLFGGGQDNNPQNNNDTWLWNGTIWTQASPAASPSARVRHAMAYDSARGFVVLFGGLDASGSGGSLVAKSDTWEWDGTAWHLRTPAHSPSARTSHAMAYDSVRHKTVLFGGFGSSVFGDTWEWDGTDWAQVATTGPTPRYDLALAYDSGCCAQTTLFGGYDGNPPTGRTSDTWSWNGTLWSQISASGPSARNGHKMTYDSGRSRLVLFGGYALPVGYNGETWETAQCASQCVPPPAGMVAWWPMDETSGSTVADISGSGLDGTASPGPIGPLANANGPTPVNGEVRGGLYFWHQYDNQYINVPNNPALTFATNDFSINAWVFITQYNGTELQPIVEKMQYSGTTPVQGYRFYLASGVLTFQVAVAGVITTTAVATTDQVTQDVWHLVAVTYHRPSSGNQTVVLYIDGAPAASTSLPSVGNFGNSTSDLIIGGSILGSALNYLDIHLDEVEMFNVALAQQDIQSIFNAGSAGKCKPACYTGITVACPANKTVQAGSNWTFDPPAGSSCCGSNVTVAVTGTVTNGVANITFTGGGSAANGTVSFVGDTAVSGYLDITAGTNAGTYTLSPGAGTNTLFVWDNLISPGSNPFVDSTGGLLFTNSGLEINLYANGPGSYSLLGAPPAYEPEATNGAATLAVSSQTITRTWLLTDACGNSNTCSQTVTVANNTPLVLTCAGDKTVPCGTAWSFDAPTASGGCSGSNVAVSVAGTVTNGVCPQVITRTWLATDACGNTNTCGQTVTVVNTNPPVILCPSNIVVISCSNVPVCYNVTATSACCSNVTVVTTPPSCSHFAPGTVTTVNCEATDCCGNTAACSFTVTVGTNCCTNTVASLALNTGYNQNSDTVYGYGQADAFWWVTKDPTVPATTLPRPATVVEGNAAWQPAQANSQWISSYATEVDNLNGEYDFQAYFCTLADASNLALSVCLRADDFAAVALNGHLLPLSGSTVFKAASPACGTALQSSGWFVLGGQNVLTLYVTNAYAVAMGVNATVSVTGSGLIPVGSPCCQFGSGISGQKFYDLNCNGVRDPGSRRCRAGPSTCPTARAR